MPKGKTAEELTMEGTKKIGTQLERIAKALEVLVTLMAKNQADSKK